jgi:hypothetical protein
LPAIVQSLINEKWVGMTNKKLVYIVVIVNVFGFLLHKIFMDFEYQNLRSSREAAWTEQIRLYTDILGGPRDIYKARLATILTDQLSDYTYMYRKRGLLALKIDEYCSIGIDYLCVEFLDTYLKKTNNRILSSFYVEHLSKQAIIQALSQTHFPDRHYFTLKKAIYSNYSTEKFILEWETYIPHLFNRHPSLKTKIDGIRVQVLNEGLFTIPKGLEVKIKADKKIKVGSCRNCKIINIGQELKILYKTYREWSNRKDVIIKVHANTTLIITPAFED